jgi:hypothetical protein
MSGSKPTMYLRSYFIHLVKSTCFAVTVAKKDRARHSVLIVLFVVLISAPTTPAVLFHACSRREPRDEVVDHLRREIELGRADGDRVDRCARASARADA